ncbi:MAG: hypothetical protein IAI49_11570 [Candidatus Eremiobacteraeota bacterium]|nr:hypothetical protein [Candidatus Eremiobacteraeota bacterium]
MTVAETLATPADFLGAIAGAREIAVSAYMLEPEGDVARALEAASDRGASVSVTLERFADRPASDGLRRLSERCAAGLRAHGVDVRLGVPSGDVVHLKAAAVDGIAFLDDRNWASAGETIVATSRPDDVALVRDAIAGRTGATERLATEKAAALRLETDAIRGGGDRIDVESESFGACAVSQELRARAAAGAHVRLLVNGRLARSKGARRERALLHRLAKAGVKIRTTGADEKLCIAGDRGWVGSANATFDVTPMTDWGLAVGAGAVLDALESTFEREWIAARPFP